MPKPIQLSILFLVLFRLDLYNYSLGDITDMNKSLPSVPGFELSHLETIYPP